jgi:hypothetical protein
LAIKRLDTHVFNRSADSFIVSVIIKTLDIYHSPHQMSSAKMVKNLDTHHNETNMPEDNKDIGEYLIPILLRLFSIIENIKVL